MDTYREIKYYTSTINNNIYFIKVEIFYYPIELLILDHVSHPTYFIETNNHYYDYYLPFPGNIPRIINDEEVIALYLRNEDNTRYNRYTLLHE